jgi:hypothetical protein
MKKQYDFSKAKPNPYAKRVGNPVPIEARRDAAPRAPQSSRKKTR